MTMAYKLTLTRADIAAFVWIGDRYSNGTKMLSALFIDNDKDYDGEGEITLNVPEHRAWEVKELAEEDDLDFPCFADSLKKKMWEFLDKIV